jgi:hypothetical protein
LELSRFERIASASSPAEAEVMLSPASESAAEALTSDSRPAATTPTSAAVPKNSRRPILLFICYFASQARS